MDDKVNKNTHRRQSLYSIKEKLLQETEHRCAICGTVLELKNCEVHHIVPVALGGTSDIENIQILCHNCHQYKHSSLLLSYQFEKYINDLLLLNPKYSVLSVRRTRTDIKTPDLFFENTTTNCGEKFIGEIKTNQPLTESRIIQVIDRFKEYRINFPEYKAVLIIPGELSQEYKELLAKNNIDLWDKFFIAQEFSEQIEIVEPKSFKAFFDISIGTSMANDKYQQLIDELKNCSMGVSEWGKYQKIIEKILEILLCPPLNIPIAQSNDSAKKNRRDFVMPNYSQEKDIWNFLRDRYNAEFVVIETKNSSKPITKQDVLQIANYLKKDGCGLFGIIISRKGLGKNTKDALRDKWLFDRKMIVVLDDIDIEQMILEKKNGNDPAELIRKKIEDFRLSI